MHNKYNLSTIYKWITFVCDNVSSMSLVTARIENLVQLLQTPGR